MKSIRNKRGQALVEYIIIFSFLALIAIKMVQGVSGYLSDTMGNLAYYLSQQLSVGVCDEHCFFSGYKNRAINE
ncbi:MAG: hypothetical protein HN576_02350 [Bacteriovoracaceae bacterium]|jgi:Flp pilus assembly pilin Flp|nr:hypothetical protein [Bacteriovoracaceae bacterium]